MDIKKGCPSGLIHFIHFLTGLGAAQHAEHFLKQNLRPVVVAKYEKLTRKFESI
jgi:hypothetical protein